MDARQFRTAIVAPALISVGLHSEAAENLIVGTALTESRLEFVEQHGHGPARSFMQIEKATYDDCHRYLRLRNPKLKELIECSILMDSFPPFECSTWNMRLAVLVARVKYYMDPSPLPDAGDANGMYEVYKRVYNTPLGRATYGGSISHFLRACAS